MTGCLGSIVHFTALFQILWLEFFLDFMTETFWDFVTDTFPDFMTDPISRFHDWNVFLDFVTGIFFQISWLILFPDFMTVMFSRFRDWNLFLDFMTEMFSRFRDWNLFSDFVTWPKQQNWRPLPYLSQWISATFYFLDYLLLSLHQHPPEMKVYRLRQYGLLMRYLELMSAGLYVCN